MKKPKQSRIIEEVYGDCASVNDMTGLFQRIHLNPEEVELFHKMYNGIDGKDSIEE